MLRLNTRSATGFVEALQPLVPERPDHLPTIPRCATRNNSGYWSRTAERSERAYGGLLIKDLRYAVRRLVHAPLFTISAVVVLAFSIGLEGRGVPRHRHHAVPATAVQGDADRIVRIYLSALRRGRTFFRFVPGVSRHAPPSSRSRGGNAVPLAMSGSGRKRTRDLLRTGRSRMT